MRDCTKSRTRSCSDPAPKKGGANCPGEGREETICTDGACGNQIFKILIKTGSDEWADTTHTRLIQICDGLYPNACCQTTLQPAKIGETATYAEQQELGDCYDFALQDNVTVTLIAQSHNAWQVEWAKVQLVGGISWTCPCDNEWISTDDHWAKTEITKACYHDVKGGGNLPVVFVKSEEFNIEKNNLVGELSRIGRQYIITFQVLLTAYLSDYHKSIIHFTIGGDSQVYGDRTPALLTSGQDGRSLVLASAINGDPNHNIYLDDLISLSLNTWYDIEIAQIEYGSEIRFYVKFDGATVANITNADARVFEDVKIFAGSVWGEPAVGKLRQLRVKTK